ncbi:MAG TPA: hypothetical protein VFV97_16120 [Rhodanobacteraceae bacterium]|nr:hypothetical protein [Rhodanobacteraceae bacterium]
MRTVWLALAALLGSAGTLLCCVLPAVMVTLGAGATLAGLVTAVPQLIWLSEHKGLVFGTAGALLIVAAVALGQARRLPCPADPRVALACARARALSRALYWMAVIAFLLGATFAFLLPRLNL